MKKMKMLYSVLLLIFSLSTQAQESFHVEVTGSGQPVLLFPGFTSTAEVFDEITQELSKNYEVHAFTFAGFGEVPPISFPWLSKIKEDIQSYVSKKKWESPIIPGHSMGGTLGLWLASEDTTYAKLIIIDALPAMGALMIPDYDPDNISYDTPYNKQILEMDETAFHAMAVQMTSGMAVNTEKHQQLIEWMLGSDRETYVYGFTDLLKLDLRPLLQDIQTPVSIFVATEPYGQQTVMTTYKEQYADLKDHKLIYAEGAGHFIMFDEPQWLLGQIKSELSVNE